VDIDLTNEVTGILPVANGGTGTNTLDNLIALGNHTTGDYVATIADSGSGTITVTGSGSETAAVTLGIANDSITDTHLAFNTGQHLTTSSNVTFSSLTVSTGITTTTNQDLTLTANGAGIIRLNDTIASSSLSGGGVQCLQVDNNGVISGIGSACGSGGGMSVGGAVTSGTPGSILFVGAGPVLAQDNSGLFWDDADNELGINTTTP